MFYRIRSISTAKATGLAYIIVDFYQSFQDAAQGKAPVLSNDFLMGLRDTEVRVPTDVLGRVKLQSGAFIHTEVEVEGEWVPLPEDPADPYQRQTVTLRVPNTIHDNIRRYMVRSEARGDTGNKVGQVEHDESDPHGILARPDVQALVGKDFGLATAAEHGPGGPP